MSLLKRILIMLALLISFVIYEIKGMLNVSPENVIITGTCNNLETSDPVTMVKDQLMIVTIHKDKYEGIVRKTGEQIICPVTSAVYVFDKYKNLPSFIRPSESETLIPLNELKVEDNGIRDLKNQNILVSGTCNSGDKVITLNQEPSTVLDTERVKGKYYLSIFQYATSSKLKCLFTDVSVSQASDFHIEKAKLKVMNPDQMIGKTLLLTGICRPEAANDPVYMNLINARVKVIDIEFKDGKPATLRAGVESKSKIVNCGGVHGKFVLEPYISVSNPDN